MTVQTNDKLVYMAFNKPAGVVSTMEDPGGSPCISDFLRPSMSERVIHVGRLDVETEGLLLLTNDGELANRLTHPSTPRCPRPIWCRFPARWSRSGRGHEEGYPPGGRRDPRG